MAGSCRKAMASRRFLHDPVIGRHRRGKQDEQVLRELHRINEKAMDLGKVM